MHDRGKISDRLFQQLREAIVSGEFAEGSRHSIYGLAERFGVSRTPVRDAVLRLADAGMVTVERNRGVRVRRIGVDDVRHIFELRLMLEIPAARFAAAHRSAERARLLEDDVQAMADAVAQDDATAFVARDVAMHERIIDSVGNERLSDQVRALREATIMRDVSTFGRSRSLAEVHAEHLPIVRAVIDGDAEGAAKAMRDHLVETAWLLMKQVGRRTQEPTPTDWPAELLFALGV